jgi:hypothetical protein
LAITVVSGPNTPINTPPSGGPSAVAVHIVDSKRDDATSSPSRGTSAFRHAPLAARNAMSHAPTTTATISSCQNVSRPSANAPGTVASAANRSRSVATITRRLRRNSIHGPSGTANAAPTASPAAASSDTAAGPASSTRIAISGNASNASQVPAVLTANAAHNHPKSRPSRTHRSKQSRRTRSAQ